VLDPFFPSESALYKIGWELAEVNASNPLPPAVRRFLEEWPGASIGVVAVSGGADSVALLRALASQAAGPLVVAHLNHQLRGSESDADEAFVRELHAQLVAAGARLLPLWSERLDVRRGAQGANLESVARRLRYEWLTAVARQAGAAWVATGHTADDQAETVLHRLLRGSGLRGLAGIPRRRQLATGVTVVRPLLAVRRSDVLAYLEERDQPFRQDSSNWERQYTRNRLRHDLLPVLAEQYNPAIVEVLGRLAQQAGDVEAFVEQQAATVLAGAELPRAGQVVVLDARRLATEAAVLVRAALYLLWEREHWSLAEIGFEDWQRVLEVVQGVRAAIDLAGGRHVRRAGHVVQIS
jgi:tRNA(Ile)-lysidine synthase